ncbi:hypothetical protein HZC35_07340 [Candidatus Saganbacteria bacterium]|nr:hypothetical protein [Candidatus Saganbacteria bacterium]
MAITPNERIGGPRGRHDIGGGTSTRAISFIPLASVSRVGHTIFKSAAPKAAWPLPQALIVMRTPQLREWGIIKLERLTFNGDRGTGFVTVQEAEALRLHLQFANREELSRAQIVAVRNGCTLWSAIGRRTASEDTESPINERKAWLNQGRAFLEGRGEDPGSILVRVNANGEVHLFSSVFPLSSVKNILVRVSLEREEDGQGFLIVKHQNGKPVSDRQGNKLGKILFALNGMMIPLRHFWY